jgi:hypothetical protein
LQRPENDFARVSPIPPLPHPTESISIDAIRKDFEMNPKTRQARKVSGTQARSLELKDSLGQLAFDLASLKSTHAPADEIHAVECIWRKELREYRKLQAAS